MVPGIQTEVTLTTPSFGPRGAFEGFFEAILSSFYLSFFGRRYALPFSMEYERDNFCRTIEIFCI